MDVLAIQASSVPCERVFSSAKETISPRRNKLHPEMMEACQMLKYSFKSSGTELNLTSHYSTHEIWEDMADADATRLEAPEEVAEFQSMMSAYTGERMD